MTSRNLSNVLTMGGTGGFEILREKRGFLISENIQIECKNAEGDKIAARIVEVDDQDCVEISVGDVSGWVRLHCAGDVDGNILGVRMLMRFTLEGVNASPRIRATLAVSDPAKIWRNAVAETRFDATVTSSAWQELTGLFLCAPRNDRRRVDMLLNLPPNATVTFAAADLHSFKADLDLELEAMLDDATAQVIRPFECLVHPEATLSELIKKEIVFHSDARIEGFDVTGYVLSSGSAREVALSAPPLEETIRVMPELDAELLPGVRLACGFQAPLSDFLDAGARVLDLVWSGGDGQPLASLKVPAQLRLLRMHETGEDFPSENVETADVPVRLFFFPDYSSTNPYQRLMYRNMPNIHASAGDLNDAIRELESGDTPGRVVLHLHWLTPLLAGCKTVEAGERACREVVNRLQHFVNLGGILVWTVHNVASHDGQLFEVECKLGQCVADLATTIHVHSERLLPILMEYYNLAASRIVIQPHPHFLGYYPNYVMRETARARLKYSDTDKVFLFCGQLRPYKGIDALVSAFAEISKNNPDAHLLIVGKSVFPFSPGDLTRKFKGFRNVRVIEGHVPDSDLQWYFRASDWVVMPYKNILTSGSLLCAMSFEQPCIAPRLGTIPDLIKDGETGISYAPEDPEGLKTALQAACGITADERSKMARAALAAVEPLTWGKMGAALEGAIKNAYAGKRVLIKFEDSARDCVLLGRDFPPVHIASTAIIILNYEHIDDVQRLVETLNASANRDFDIYVVDNQSPSLSTSALALALRDVFLLRLPENLGYAAGNNAAMRLVKNLGYEFMWILNPDMVVSERALDQHLQAARDHPDVSLFGAVIGRGGKEDFVASAGGYVSFEDGVNTNHMFAGKRMDVLPKDPYLVDFVTGASVFLRTAVLDEIGYIPEDYFLYFEETHWLLEASRKGFRCMVLPNIRLAHFKRSEADGLPAKYYFYYYIRNTLLFFNRMTGEPAKLALTRLTSGFVSSWLSKIEARSPSNLATYKRISDQAIHDGLAGNAGRFDLVKLETGLSDLRELPEGADPFGSFTICGDGRLSGAISVKMPIHGPAMVHVLCDGRVIEGVQCKGENDNQRFQFSMQLPPALRAGRSVHLEFRLNGASVENGQMLKLFARMDPVFKGRIDGIAQFICSGWAWNKNDPEERVTVEVMHNGEVIGSTVADQYRADLARHNIGNGYAGFSIRLPRQFADGAKRVLQLRVAGETEVLSERNVTDHVVAGGAGMKPLENALEDLFHQRQFWLAKHDLTDLPVGRFFDSMARSLTNRYANRPETECVSIIMPCFNRIKVVEAAIKSVIAQSYTNWELLVIDDGSTDGTPELVESMIVALVDDRIRLIRLPENRGVSAARNAGLEVAKGDLIAYLDSDNVWDPDFLRVMTGELMCASDSPSAAYCGQLIKQVIIKPDGERLVEEVAVRSAPFDMALMENRNYVDLNCYVHRRHLFDKYGGFTETLRRLVDWEMILRYSRIESPLYVPVLLSHYFFDNVDNQITKVENYDDSFALFNEVAEGHLQRRQPDLPLRPVDILVLPAAGVDPEAFARRVDEIVNSLPDRADIQLMLPTTVDCLDGVSRSFVPCGVMMSEAGPQPFARILANALQARRPDADLMVMQANIIPQKGWFVNLQQAIRMAPQGGVFVPRHMIPGERVHDLRSEIPFAQRQRDVCVVLSNRVRRVVNPELNRIESLVEISGFEGFCFCVTRDCAADIWVDNQSQAGVTETMNEIADQIRFGQKRQLIYCGRVSVYDLPI